MAKQKGTVVIKRISYSEKPLSENMLTDKPITLNFDTMEREQEREYFFRVLKRVSRLKR